MVITSIWNSLRDIGQFEGQNGIAEIFWFSQAQSLYEFYICFSGRDYEQSALIKMISYWREVLKVFVARTKIIRSAFSQMLFKPVLSKHAC